MKNNNGQLFRTSSYSGGTNCVAVAIAADGSVLVRDSKQPTQEELRFTSSEWDAFIKGVKNKEFELIAKR